MPRSVLLNSTCVIFLGDRVKFVGPATSSSLTSFHTAAHRYCLLFLFSFFPSDVDSCTQNTVFFFLLVLFYQGDRQQVYRAKYSLPLKTIYLQKLGLDLIDRLWMAMISVVYAKKTVVSFVLVIFLLISTTHLRQKFIVLIMTFVVVQRLHFG